MKKIKTIKFRLTVPIKDLQEGKEFEVFVSNKAHLIEGLAQVDKIVMNDPESSIFPIYEDYIHCYLQMFVDLKREELYDDVGVFAYGPDDHGDLRKFNPVRDNIYFNLHPNSLIELQQDVGC